MNWGVWKSFGLASTTLSHRASESSASEEGKQFSFPLPKGWKIGKKNFCPDPKG